MLKIFSEWYLHWCGYRDTKIHWALHLTFICFAWCKLYINKNVKQNYWKSTSFVQEDYNFGGDIGSLCIPGWPQTWWSSCLNFLSTGITSLNHHAWLTVSFMMLTVCASDLHTGLQCFSGGIASQSLALNKVKNCMPDSLGSCANN
jgi:hypothetical protein